MPKNETTTTEEKRPVGRPSTFPEGTNVVAFTTKVSEETLDRLREMAKERKSPFQLDHNSIGAELHRVVEQAYNRFAKDRDKRSS